MPHKPDHVAPVFAAVSTAATRPLVSFDVDAKPIRTVAKLACARPFVARLFVQFRIAARQGE